jgi:hypothetical protein
MPNPFLGHPHRTGETYLQHLRFAWSVGGDMLAGGLACLVHGLTPWLFETTGSRAVQRIQAKIAARASNAAAPKHTPGPTLGQTGGRHSSSPATGAPPRQEIQT